MSFFNVLYSADITQFNVHTVAADNPEKLALLCHEVLVAADEAGENAILDFKLSGTGAGPNWEAVLVTGVQVPEEPFVVASVEIGFVVAATGANPEEVAVNLKQALADFVAARPGSTTNVYKVEIAGGGIGTIFMAAALITNFVD